MQVYAGSVWVRLRGAIGIFYLQPFLAVANNDKEARHKLIEAAERYGYESRGVHSCKLQDVTANNNECMAEYSKRKEQYENQN